MEARIKVKNLPPAPKVEKLRERKKSKTHYFTYKAMQVQRARREWEQNREKI